jgi:hypothetical protein
MRERLGRRSGANGLAILLPGLDLQSSAVGLRNKKQGKPY